MSNLLKYEFAIEFDVSTSQAFLLMSQMFYTDQVGAQLITRLEAIFFIFACAACFLSFLVRVVLSWHTASTSRFPVFNMHIMSCHSLNNESCT